MISQSPISDPGYSSNASTPWLDKEECERFPEQKHTLLEMDTSMDSTISDGPNSPSPPPTQAKSIFNSSSSSGRGHSSKPSLSSSHNYGGHEQQMSMSTRRTAAGLLPLQILLLFISTSLNLPLPLPLPSMIRGPTGCEWHWPAWTASDN
jgi:hypothetical protein